MTKLFRFAVVAALLVMPCAFTGCEGDTATPDAVPAVDTVPEMDGEEAPAEEAAPEEAPAEEAAPEEAPAEEAPAAE